MRAAVFTLLVLAIFTGASFQRVTGLGFALTVGPLAVMLIGPYQGVLLANLLSIIVAGVVLVANWRAVEMNKALLLVPAGLAGVVPGTIAARGMSPALLQVLMGSFVVLGLGATAFGERIRFAPTVPRTLGLGMASGVMTATAGVGGPALTIFALATSWEQSAFVATGQLAFCSQSVAAVAVKGLPELTVVRTGVLVLALIMGLALGGRLAARASPDQIRVAMISIAILGALATTARGVTTLAA